MLNRKLKSKLHAMEAPWRLRNVDMRLDAGEVEILRSLDGEQVDLACPVQGTNHPLGSGVSVQVHLLVAATSPLKGPMLVDSRGLRLSSFTALD